MGFRYVPSLSSTLALNLFSGAAVLEQRHGSHCRVINALLVCARILHGKSRAQGGLSFLGSFHTEGLLEPKHL